MAVVMVSKTFGKRKGYLRRWLPFYHSRKWRMLTPCPRLWGRVLLFFREIMNANVENTAIMFGLGRSAIFSTIRIKEREITYSLSIVHMHTHFERNSETTDGRLGNVFSKSKSKRKSKSKSKMCKNRKGCATVKLVCLMLWVPYIIESLLWVACLPTCWGIRWRSRRSWGSNPPGRGLKVNMINIIIGIIIIIISMIIIIINIVNIIINIIIIIFFSWGSNQWEWVNWTLWSA